MTKKELKKLLVEVGGLRKVIDKLCEIENADLENEILFQESALNEMESKERAGTWNTAQVSQQRSKIMSAVLALIDRYVLDNETVVNNEQIDLLTVLADFQTAVNFGAKQYDQPEKAQKLFQQILTFNTTETLFFEEERKKIIQNVLQDKDIRNEHKCVFVSALTVNLLQQFDDKIFDLLLLAIFEAEEKVWQRALFGVILGTHKWNESLKDHSKLITKLGNLQGEARVQLAINDLAEGFEPFMMIYENQSDDLESILQIANLYNSTEQQFLDIFKNFTDQNPKQSLLLCVVAFNMAGIQRQENIDLFKENPFYWFLPFYDQEQFRKKILQDGKNISYKDLYNSISQLPFVISDSYKYQALVSNLTLPELRIKKNIEAFTFFAQFIKQEGINTDSMRYFSMFMDLWTFQKYFPNNNFQKMIRFDEMLRQNTYLELIAEKSNYYKFLMQRSISQGDYETYVRLATKYNPQNNDSWNNLGLSLYQEKNYAQAIDAYRKAIEIKPDFYDAWSNLGTVYNKIKDYPQAINAYRKAVEIKPNHEEWYYLGLMYTTSEHYEQAIYCYQQSIQMNSNFYNAWNSLGLMYRILKNYPQASDSYRKAIEIKPDDHEVWNNLGNAYANQGNYAQAIDAYQKAIEIKPDYDKAWYNLGSVYYNQKDHAQAIDAYRKAIEIKPDKHEAWNNLGSVYKNQGNYAQAIDAYRKAIEIKPDFHEVWDNLGFIYIHLKDYENAEKAYKKALEIKPDFDSPIYNLACVYSLQNHKKKSLSYLQQAISLNAEWKTKATEDTDFQWLWQDSDFKKMVT